MESSNKSFIYPTRATFKKYTHLGPARPLRWGRNPHNKHPFLDAFLSRTNGRLRQCVPFRRFCAFYRPHREAPQIDNRGNFPDVYSTCVRVCLTFIFASCLCCSGRWIVFAPAYISANRIHSLPEYTDRVQRYHNISRRIHLGGYTRGYYPWNQVLPSRSQFSFWFPTNTGIE